MKSSLGGHNVNHATTGSGGSHAIPRSEGVVEDTYRPTRWPIPEAVREWRFNAMRRIHLGALSPGDYFTTSLTHRRGWVLAQGQDREGGESYTRKRPMSVIMDTVAAPLGPLQAVTRVEWEGFEGAPGEVVNLSASALVVSGWWEVNP